MPLFDFTCVDCGANREVLASADKCNKLEFVCIQCGGTMSLGPVMNIHLQSGRADKIQLGTPRTQAGCGHVYACRCAIKLTEPNPFRRQLAESKLTSEQV